MDNSTDKVMEGLNPPSILPPHYWIGSVLSMLGARFLLPLNPVLNPDQLLYGYITAACTLVAGFWLAIQGSRQFSDVGTNIIPFTPATSLVTNGVFQLSRNPMYTGMVLTLIGLALLTNQLWSWLIMIAFTLVVRYRFIAREEIQMLNTFGEAFRRYRQQVRRWL